MSFHATVYRVLIASPGDLMEERAMIEDVIHSWNASHAVADGVVLLPVRWETHSVPEYGDRPQAILNRRIVADCDILVGAFWTRLGTPTGPFPSGTVEEITQFSSAGKPTLLYFSSRQIDPDRVDLEQLKQVRDFRSQMQRVALIDQFSSPSELQFKLGRHLQDHVRRLVASESRDAFRSASGEPDREASPTPGPEITPSVDEPTASHETGPLYKEYWEQFRQAVSRSGLGLRPPAARPTNWVRLSAGRSGMRLYAFTSIRERFLGAELILVRPECEDVFAGLFSARKDIEREFGSELEWNERGRSYRIVLRKPGYNPADRADWTRQHEWLIESVQEFRRILLSRVDHIRNQIQQ